MTADLRTIAHEALALHPMPLLPYQTGGRHRRDGLVAFSTFDAPGPGFNFVASFGDATLGELLPQAADFFGGRTDYGVLVEGDAGSSLEAELRAAGWAVAEDEPAYVLTHSPLIPPELPPGFSVRTLRAEDGLADHVAVAAEAFAMPADVVEKFVPSADCLEDVGVAFLLGEYRGEPAATAVSLVAGFTCVIAGVATRPALRGRGFGSAMTLSAVYTGRVRGCKTAALRSGPTAEPLYQRLGFVRACLHRTYAPPG